MPQETFKLTYLFGYLLKQNSVRGKQHTWCPNVALIPSFGPFEGKI